MTELLLNSLPEGKISFPRKHVSVFISCEILKRFGRRIWPIFLPLFFFFDTQRLLELVISDMKNRI